MKRLRELTFLPFFGDDRTFASDGLMQKRQMSGNEIAIKEEERWFQDGVDVDDVEISERDG